MKSFKIRHIFTLTVILSIIISVMVIGSMSVYRSTQNIKSEAAQKLELLSINTANDLDQIILAVEQQVDTFSSIVTDQLATHRIDPTQSRSYSNVDLKAMNHQLDPILYNFASSLNTAHVNMYYYFNDNLSDTASLEDAYLLYEYQDTSDDFIRVTGLQPIIKEGDNPDDYPWYYEPKKVGSSLWVGPYFDTILEKQFISYVVPLYDSGKFLGVVGADIEFAKIQNVIESVRIYETGYGLLINEKYDFLSHPIFTPEDNLQTVDQGGLAFMINELKQNPTGSIEYFFRGEEKLLGYATLSNGWVVATAPVESEILADIIRMRNSIILTAILCIILGSIFAYWMGSQIATPIETLTRFFKRVSGFDLTYDRSALWLTSYTNEIGELSKAIYKIIIDQHKIIQSMQATSSDLSEHSESTYSKMIDVQELAEDQSFSIRELKKAIEDIARNTEETDVQAERLSTEIMDIHELLTELTDSLSEQIILISRDSSELNNKLDILSESIEFNTSQSVLNPSDSDSPFNSDLRSLDDILIINDHLLKFVELSEKIQQMIWHLRDSYDQLNSYSQHIFVSVEQQTANIEEVLATADTIADIAVVIAQSSMSVRSETERLRNKSQALDRIVSKFTLGKEVIITEVISDDE